MTRGWCHWTVIQLIKFIPLTLEAGGGDNPSGTAVKKYVAGEPFWGLQYGNVAQSIRAVTNRKGKGGT